MISPPLQIPPFKIETHPAVYEPAEDTYLMLDHLPNVAQKTFLEIGAGTGIISLFAARNAKKVVCTDINPYAIKLIRRNIKLNCKLLKCTPAVRVGDLFSPIKPSEKFDFIVFNPPYLPNDPPDGILKQTNQKKWLSKAWEGGTCGCEITDLFLQKVKKHLSPSGLILTVTSSAVGLPKFLSLAKKANLMFTVVNTNRFSFETLYLLFGTLSKT